MRLGNKFEAILIIFFFIFEEQSLELSGDKPIVRREIGRACHWDYENELFRNFASFGFNQFNDISAVFF